MVPSAQKTPKGQIVLQKSYTLLAVETDAKKLLNGAVLWGAASNAVVLLV